ncbi:MAG: hypothetical protein AAGA56_15880, partial [Myxococcota bacterium]
MVKRSRRGWGWLAFLVLGLGVSSTALAETYRARGIRVYRAPARVIFDGLPKEFDGAWRGLTTVVEGSCKLEGKALLAYDDKGIYVAADIQDPKISGGRDHLELLLGVPGRTTVSLKLFPGVAGKSRSKIAVGNRTIKGAKIVEAPHEGGFSVEGLVPWAAIPRSRRVRIGYRGALRYRDTDRGCAIGTSTATAYAELPSVSMPSELALGHGLLRRRNIETPPQFNLLVDVVGDRRLERVLVYDRYLAVLGPGYRAGEEYYYRDLNTPQILELKAKDWTGDGRVDLLIKKRVTGTRGHVDVVELISYHGGAEAPAAVFAHEVALSLEGGGTITNAYELTGEGARTEVVLEPGTEQGIDRGRFERVSNTGAPPVLVPWGRVTKQVYRLSNQGSFELVDEKTRAVVAPPPPPAPALPPTPRPT